MTELETVANAAGLKDPDILQLALSGVTPAAAVKDLRQRFPSAFRKDVRDMTPAEFDVARREFLYGARRR